MPWWLRLAGRVRPRFLRLVVAPGWLLELSRRIWCVAARMGPRCHLSRGPNSRESSPPERFGAWPPRLPDPAHRDLRSAGQAARTAEAHLDLALLAAVTETAWRGMTRCRPWPLDGFSARLHPFAALPHLIVVTTVCDSTVSLAWIWVHRNAQCQQTRCHRGIRWPCVA